MRRLRKVVPLLFIGVFVPVAFASAAEPPQEPHGYKMDDFRSPTPATLQGAGVVDSDEAYEIWKKGGTVFVDVLPRAPKPPNLPPGTIWRDKPRKNIPGSVWLPNVGYGALSPEMDRYFRDGLEAATSGDKAKPVLFYCLRDCWMSWNAARRAMLEYGYTAVTWFPDGTDGWEEFNNPEELSQPRP
ncbi:PQQ-dependent catabolism-associated CXXCW motif protein [Prosthecomicrobium sp. N25]|uniref:PQQ-dependent catabolism-associated CXXCW motif protein n=1 Tax=Prosthecomicrobium sp. N25 TaxID=3129254 RepID=UPI00307704F5